MSGYSYVSEEREWVKWVPYFALTLMIGFAAGYFFRGDPADAPPTESARLSEEEANRVHTLLRLREKVSQMQRQLDYCEEVRENRAASQAEVRLDRSLVSDLDQVTYQAQGEQARQAAEQDAARKRWISVDSPLDIEVAGSNVEVRGIVRNRGTEPLSGAIQLRLYGTHPDAPPTVGTVSYSLSGGASEPFFYRFSNVELFSSANVEAEVE